MRVLIIGGTVFLGRCLVEAALAREHEVTLFNRGRTNSRVQFIDVRDLAEWMIRLAEQRANGVFNATGPADTLTMGRFVRELEREIPDGSGDGDGAVAGMETLESVVERDQTLSSTSAARKGGFCMQRENGGNIFERARK